jgi:hypothetical protein
MTTRKYLFSAALVFALAASVSVANAQITTSASATFTRDLTIGSTGADVTALQNWLSQQVLPDTSVHRLRQPSLLIRQLTASLQLQVTLVRSLAVVLL